MGIFTLFSIIITVFFQFLIFFRVRSKHDIIFHQVWGGCFFSGNPKDVKRVLQFMLIPKSWGSEDSVLRFFLWIHLMFFTVSILSILVGMLFTERG